MHRKFESTIRSDQMLMAGYILQAFERGSMPMHAAGYFELAAWATQELGRLDVATLHDLSHGVPKALHDVINNLLYERCEAEGHIADAAALDARGACGALLHQFRVPRPASL